jgi:hypothetical protein
MKFFKFLIFFTFILFFNACGTNNQCGVNAKIIYQLGFPGCDYLIEINELLYEANNLNEWQNFLFYTDTQYVDLDFTYTNEISNCSGLEKINIFCLRNI